jgi:Ca2+-dependent lipid-binding protein
LKKTCSRDIDPFFEIKYIPRGYDKAITLYRSEFIKKELNPVWKPFELSVEMLGGIDVPFDVSVFDFDDDGGNALRLIM